MSTKAHFIQMFQAYEACNNTELKVQLQLYIVQYLSLKPNIMIVYNHEFCSGGHHPWWRLWCQSHRTCAKSEEKWIEWQKYFNTMFMANWSMSSLKRYLRAKKINLVLSTLMEEGWWLWMLTCEIISQLLLLLMVLLLLLLYYSFPSHIIDVQGTLVFWLIWL